MDMTDEDEIREMVIQKTSEANRLQKFDGTIDNLIDCRGMMIFYGIIYVSLAVIALEFIDKDKR